MSLEQAAPERMRELAGTEDLDWDAVYADQARSALVLAAASVPRRITRAEYEVCTRNLGGIAEVQLGHQAIVLTRSRLYGALALSPSNIFLALAAEIPDPAHPEALISNPNTTWDRVNGAFNNEPIEVFGPPAQSTTGIAFREILFEAGCNSFPTIAALKQTDAARYERVCSTFRKDGAYVEMPEQVPFDIFQTLQKHSSRPLTWAPPTSPKSAKCRAPRRITSNALNDC